MAAARAVRARSTRTRVGTERLTDIARSMQAFQRLRASRQVHSALMRAAGLELSQQAVQVLLAVPAESSVADIAHGARMDMGAVSRQLKVLEDDGLVTRRASPDNGSVVLVAPTAAGRRTAERIVTVRDRHLSAALAAWTDEEIDLLAHLMRRMVDDLQTTPYPTDRQPTDRQPTEETT